MKDKECESDGVESCLRWWTKRFVGTFWWRGLDDVPLWTHRWGSGGKLLRLRHGDGGMGRGEGNPG